MEEAIKLAIEKGGYDGILETLIGDGAWPTLFRTTLPLDPLFWQALGKALGWKTILADLQANSKDTPEWQYHALRFFELKLTNGDEEKFWQELLKKGE